MAGETSIYQRLPGKKKGFLIGHDTLWLGSDHLLQVYSRFGVEDYKRFYFNDIQAITTRKTAAGKIQNIVLGSLAGLFCLFTVISGGGWSIFNGIITGVMLLFLLINFFKGPTCETYLLTAVQTEKLNSLNRLTTAQQVMNRLRPRIEHGQGRINPETVLQQPVRLTVNKMPIYPPTDKRSALKTRRHEKGRVHLALFALLVLEGLFIASTFFYSHIALTLMSSGVSLLMGICVVVALVKQHESNLKQSLRTVTWAALGYVCFSFPAGYIISMGIAFKNPQIMQNQWELFNLISNITPWQNPLMMTFSIVALCATALIGFTGLCMLKNPQQAIHKPSDLPAATAHVADPKRIAG